MKKKIKRVRISMEMPDTCFKRLDKLSNHTGSSKTEVVRRALAVYETLVIYVADGNYIAIVDENGKTTPLSLL